ncbi:4'-phosphopantetheinyl transferase superfamily protein [Uliginosibacterium sp. H3]|uniref:4'-phosphopantetheinyl transferase superfamily protein n=1 Tax=Uliginosibacterium silvisoli TaxID=3114758 RepID=A0ABU6K2Z2_9RHOO|nr:4'-phosphopantetheinyl transferase superfamily protein [Uliginosibacterium sp. H3]
MQIALQTVALPSGTPDTLEVFILDIKEEAHRLPQALAILNKDEQDRHNWYNHPTSARRFALTRAALRQRLAERTGGEATALRFEYGPHGKPALRASQLRFNVAHSGQYALIAISTTHDVGIDIERHASTAPLDTLSSSIFSDEERAWCAGDSARFYALWCGKEAMIKADGTGFSVANGMPVAMLRDDGSYISPRPGLQAWSLAMPPGYAAALALLADEPSSHA